MLVSIEDPSTQQEIAVTFTAQVGLDAAGRPDVDSLGSLLEGRGLGMELFAAPRGLKVDRKGAKLTRIVLHHQNLKSRMFRH